MRNVSAKGRGAGDASAKKREFAYNDGGTLAAVRSLVKPPMQKGSNNNTWPNW
jgi:hypothetical protein